MALSPRATENKAAQQFRGLTLGVSLVRVHARVGVDRAAIRTSR